MKVPQKQVKKLQKKKPSKPVCVVCAAKKKAASAATTPPEVIKAAQDAQRATGVPASITLSQWALESGHGKHMPAGSNNPFGIKAKKGQAGVDAPTKEDYGHGLVSVTQKFAKFDSLSDAFTAHANLLANGKPYKKAMADKGDPKKMAQDLQGTYATDHQYASKLDSVMDAGNYTQYDTLPPQ